MYRHAHPNNLEEFNLYVKNTLLKLLKKTKKYTSVVTSIVTNSNMKMIQLYKTFTT